MDDILYTLQHAQDIAIKEKNYKLDTYKYLNNNKVKRLDAQRILRSSVVQEISSTILDINLSLKSGNQEDIIYAKEAYGHLSKPEARKLLNYYDGIIDGIKRYINEKKGGKKISAAKTRSK